MRWNIWIVNKVKMQITHEEARRLIHLASDDMLKAPQNGMLASHLASCEECRKYAESIQKMESILHTVLQRQWMQQPVPFSIGALVSRPNHKLPDSILLATRITAVAVMFLVFMFSVWQFTLSGTTAAGPIPASVPPIPVPSISTQLISTKMQSRTCEATTYIVHENDTLSSIAIKFSTSKKEILIANHMKSETVITGARLIIPVCNFTPTGTANTLTTTFTPVLHTITSTPGG